MHKAEDAGPARALDRRRLRRGRRDHGPRARHRAEAHLRRGEHRAAPDDGQVPALRARLQHPLQPDQPTGGRRRGDGRAQGPRPPGAAHVPRGWRRAGADRRRTGRDRPRSRPGARLRRRHRRARAPACSRRPSPRRPRRTSSASRSCSAGPDRARARGLRDLGRRRLPARERVLRVPARAEAHRRPDVRRGHHRHALQRLGHRRVRRPDAGLARHQRRGEGRDEADPRRDPGRLLRRRVDPRERDRPPALPRAARRRQAPPDRADRGEAARDDALRLVGQGRRCPTSPAATPTRGSPPRS